MNAILFERLNKYHPKIKLASELNPKKFLDASLICFNGIYNTMINRKSTKSPFAWSSKVPKHFKRTLREVSIFGVFLVRIQSECGKIRTRKTPNTDIFHAVATSLLGIYIDQTEFR